MAYFSIKTQPEIVQANRSFAKTLRVAARTKGVSQVLGFRPDNTTLAVYWNKHSKFWFGTRKKHSEKYLWNAFGVTPLDRKRAINITVEINTPATLAKTGRAGLLLRDEQGQYYLAHTGRIGGGKPNVNKKSFLAFYRSRGGKLVDYDNRKSAILIGEVDNPTLAKKVATFVKAVAAFKSGSHAAPVFALSKTKGKIFRPKFIGKVSYKTKSRVEANLIHDEVVTELNRRLAPIECNYSKFNDLYIPEKNGGIRALFEIKTDISTTSIYSAVGQLLLNGSPKKGGATRLVLVIPAIPTPETKKIINALGIEILSYNWTNKKPVFPNSLPRF